MAGGWAETMSGTFLLHVPYWPALDLDELQLARSEHHHPKEEPTVLPALDVRRPVGPLLVADGNIRNLQIQFRGPE